MYGPTASNPPESLPFDLLNLAYKDIENFFNVNKMLSKKAVTFQFDYSCKSLSLLCTVAFKLVSVCSNILIACCSIFWMQLLETPFITVALLA